MKPPLLWQRILFLILLILSVLAPILLVAKRLKTLNSMGGNGFIEDVNSINYRTDVLKLTAIELEANEGLKEPALNVYKDGDYNSSVSYNFSNQTIGSEESIIAARNVNFTERNATHYGKRENRKNMQNVSTPERKEISIQARAQHGLNFSSGSGRAVDVRVNQMKDQLIRAKVYLKFIPLNRNSHLVKELKLRIKEVERALGEATRDSELSRSFQKRMKSMEGTLLKASHIYTDCPTMVSRLRAMTFNSEEQVRAQMKQETYLAQLAARTTPKGLHCLSMRLTAEYFALDPEEKKFLYQDKLPKQELNHFVIFSDNLLASAVVVNSTVSNAMEPQKVVLHVVTDSLNFPAISMWFLLNPPGKATIEIQSVESFKWLKTDYNSILKKDLYHDPRYTCTLNHIRFYLPDIFLGLNKIVLLDHDVVVQRDLSQLWSVDMKGKVIGAVETCNEGESSFRRMDMFINFSDPIVAKNFDVKSCTWAFGLNVFDLQEWRRQGLTNIYHKYLHLGFERQMWKPGSLPLGWVTFYNQTVGLDRRWHALGLGEDLGLSPKDIESASVIHFNGVMKPWLDTCIGKYKGYWSKFVKYDHPYLRDCNIRQ